MPLRLGYAGSQTLKKHFTVLGYTKILELSIVFLTLLVSHQKTWPPGKAARKVLSRRFI
jgi:hypothetical protein